MLIWSDGKLSKPAERFHLTYLTYIYYHGTGLGVIPSGSKDGERSKQQIANAGAPSLSKAAQAQNKHRTSTWVQSR